MKQSLFKLLGKMMLKFLNAAALIIICFSLLTSFYILNQLSLSLPPNNMINIPQRLQQFSAQSSSSSLATTTMLDYTFPLMILRCFTTPGCFPSFKCRTGVPQKIKRKKRWEEQSFCVDDLRQRTGISTKNKQCLVYSFGIHVSWEWEEKVAKLFGCEVHAFDPTMNHPTLLAPNVTFHKLGLQGDGTDMSSTHSVMYEAIDPILLFSLPQIMERLGHVNRTIDVLMIDCEGCEWGVLKQMACNGHSSSVQQLVMELHFQKSLGLSNKADVWRAAKAVNCLEQERWGIVSIESSGASQSDWNYAEGVVKVIKSSGFLMNVAMQRRLDGQPMFEELAIKKIEAKKQWYNIEHLKVRKAHGEVRKEWPEAAEKEVAAVIKDMNKATKKFKKLSEERFQFDNHPRMEE